VRRLPPHSLLTAGNGTPCHPAWVEAKDRSPPNPPPHRLHRVRLCVKDGPGTEYQAYNLRGALSEMTIRMRRSSGRALMFESEVGVRVAAIRQNAGRLGKTSPSGAVKVPAAIGSAAVIVVSGSAKPERLSHVAAAADVAVVPTTEARSAAAHTPHRKDECWCRRGEGHN